MAPASIDNPRREHQESWTGREKWHARCHPATIGDLHSKAPSLHRSVPAALASASRTAAVSPHRSRSCSTKGLSGAPHKRGQCVGRHCVYRRLMQKGREGASCGRGLMMSARLRPARTTTPTEAVVRAITRLTGSYGLIATPCTPARRPGEMSRIPMRVDCAAGATWARTVFTAETGAACRINSRTTKSAAAIACRVFLGWLEGPGGH